MPPRAARRQSARLFRRALRLARGLTTSGLAALVAACGVVSATPPNARPEVSSAYPGQIIGYRANGLPIRLQAGGSGGITRGNASPQTIGVDTTTATWSSNPTFGQTVLVYIMVSNGETITSVVDNGVQPATFVRDSIGNNVSGTVTAQIWRANAITLPATGSYAVTVTCSGGHHINIVGVAYSGVQAGPPTAVNQNTSGSASPATTNSVTPLRSGALYAAAFTEDTTSGSETITLTGSGFTSQFNNVGASGAFYSAAADKIDSGGPTSTACTWTYTQTQPYATAIAVYDAGPSLIQAKSGITSGAPGLSLTITLTNGTTAGNCLIVAVTTDGATTDCAIAAIKLGGAAGNFHSDEGGTGNDTLGIWSDYNCAGGQTSVVITTSGGSGTQGLTAWVMEWTGLLSTATPFDKAAIATPGSASTSWSSGNTATLSQPWEVAIGLEISGGTNTGPASPWTNFAALSDTFGANAVTGFNVVSATTALAYAGTNTPSSISTTAIATYKVAPIAVSASDTGHGVDSASAAVKITAADTGHGADSAAAKVEIAVSDTGHGAEGQLAGFIPSPPPSTAQQRPPVGPLILPKATKFRYVSTDLITGEVKADDIPLTVESFTQQLNGGGSLSGQLALSSNYKQNAPWLAALEPRRSVLWVLANNYPVWNGVVWDWPDMSRSGGVLPISAQTMDSIFNHRLISATLDYPQVDIFAVFIDLVQYATSKTSTFITTVSPFQGPASPLVGAAAHVAGLVLPAGAAAVSGESWNATYMYSDLGTVGSALQDLVTSGQLEYAFVPGLTASGSLVTNLYLGINSLGRNYPESGYSIVYPGNANDYGFQRTGSQSSNFVWAVAPPNGSAEQWESGYPHGVDLSDLLAGYPLMESTVTWQGSTVTMQSQVDGFADGQMALLTQAMTLPVINIPDGVRPLLTDLVLGDEFPFAATSPLHPAKANGVPGYQGLVRLTGWTCYPTGPQQTAYVQLATSAILVTP